MAFSDSDEVRANAMWHYQGETRQSAIALILLQMRPQALAPSSTQARKMADMLLRNLRASGWESPALMFRGGHLATSSHVQISGALGAGDIAITNGDEVFYEGPLDRPPLWTEMVTSSRSIGVLLGADPSLDKSETRNNLQRLAERDLIVAAAGQLVDD